MEGIVWLTQIIKKYWYIEEGLINIILVIK